MRQYKNIIVISIMSVLLFGLSFACFFKKADDFSESERRVLAQFPELTVDTILSGDFMEEFETYTTDQFPARDTFRTLKAVSALGVFRQKDNNDYYIKNNHISKLEYPLNEPMLQHASERFLYLYDTYMKDTNVNLYFSIVPDKNYFLAKESEYLSIDYMELIEFMKYQTNYMRYIDVTNLLELEDYYRTDTHWKQEKILDVANELGKQMGVELVEEYKINTLDIPFYGVYYGQMALPVKPDTLQYLSNDTLKNCIVTSYSTGMPKEKTIYDMEKAYGKDAYEMFLSGTEALITIENPMASTDKELILFRDSFGSSIAPLFVEAYKKITLVDIRYVQSSMIGNFVKFDNQDVLFLYSTMLLNNSLALK